jgi:hypothetical protein
LQLFIVIVIFIFDSQAAANLRERKMGSWFGVSADG